MSANYKEVYRYDNYNKKWVWVYTRGTRNKLPDTFWLNFSRSEEYHQLPKPKKDGFLIKSLDD